MSLLDEYHDMNNYRLSRGVLSGERQVRLHIAEGGFGILHTDRCPLTKITSVAVIDVPTAWVIGQFEAAQKQSAAGAPRGMHFCCSDSCVGNKTPEYRAELRAARAVASVA